MRTAATGGLGLLGLTGVVGAVGAATATCATGATADGGVAHDANNMAKAIVVVVLKNIDLAARIVVGVSVVCWLIDGAFCRIIIYDNCDAWLAALLRHYQ